MPKTEHNHKTFGIVLLVLILLIALVSLKFFVSRVRWTHYALNMQRMALDYPSLTAEEEGTMLATTLTTLPGNTSFYQQAKPLQAYISQLSKQTGRDMVVVDKSGKILADTIPTNDGKMFVEAKAGELQKTLTDGLFRTFTEQSNDYPQGITQTVVPMKNAAGDIIGAVIVSTTTLFR